MNRKQKFAIVVGALLALLPVVFPPMTPLVRRTGVDGLPLEDAEHVQHPMTVDRGSVGLLVLCAIVLTAGAVLLLKDRKA